MKVKKIIIVLVIIILIVGINVFIIFHNKNKDNNNKSIIADDGTTYTISNEVIQASETQIYLFQKLYDKGKELYDDKSYLNFEKKNDIYFISLYELSNKYNFDISEFVIEGNYCHILDSGIFFDIDNKLKKYDRKVEKYLNYVVPVLMDC